MTAFEHAMKLRSSGNTFPSKYNAQCICRNSLTKSWTILDYHMLTSFVIKIHQKAVADLKCFKPLFLH